MSPLALGGYPGLESVFRCPLPPTPWLTQHSFPYNRPAPPTAPNDPRSTDLDTAQGEDIGGRTAPTVDRAASTSPELPYQPSHPHLLVAQTTKCKISRERRFNLTPSVDPATAGWVWDRSVSVRDASARGGPWDPLGEGTWSEVGGREDR